MRKPKIAMNQKPVNNSAVSYPHMLRLAADKAREKAVKPKASFAPPILPNGVIPKDASPAIAMDYNPGVYDFANQMASSFPYDFQGFPGYPYLASLSTRAEFRAFASTMASELFRQWITIKSKSVEDEESDNERIAELEKAIEKHDLLGVFQRAAVHDCFFGRGQISINIKGADNELPLILSSKTIKQGSLESFTTIEAMWTSPSAYNAIDPTAPDFYKPREWFVLGKRVHASRILTVISRPLPDMLKPAYNFSGMSLSQLAEPYVNNWLRTRQSVSDLINNFSITALKTNMAQVLQGGNDGSDVFARADLFTLTKSNKGLMLLDKEGEELVQLNTPLSGLHELQAQAQEHLCSVSRIPAVILTGISPSGLNASSEGEIRVFYDWVKSQQHSYWYHPIDICLKVLMLNLWGEIDETITFEFNPLWQTSALEESNIRNNNATADASYIDRGVLAPEEVRTRLAKDVESGYAGIDVDDIPELPDETLDEPVFEEQAQDKSVSEKQHRAMEAAAHGKSTLGIPESVGKEFVAKDAEFKEDDHPRKDNGQFGSGGSNKESGAVEKNNIDEIYNEAVKKAPKLSRWGIDKSAIDADGNYTLYHGTNEANAKSIMDDGLNAPDSPKFFTLTTDKNVAKKFAEGYGGNTVIEFKIPLNDLISTIHAGHETSAHQEGSTDTQHAIRNGNLDKKFISKVI